MVFAFLKGLSIIIDATGGVLRNLTMNKKTSISVRNKIYLVLSRMTRMEYAALSILVVMLCMQLCPLIWMRPFYVDWTNHIWLIKYYSEYLHSYYQWSETINTDAFFGNPMPVFYGIFFYPLVSLIACLTDADFAARLFISGLFTVSIVSTCLAVWSITSNVTYALSIATLTNSSVYQLTNVYSRSALTEFTATELLITGLSITALGFASKSPVRLSLYLNFVV